MLPNCVIGPFDLKRKGVKHTSATAGSGQWDCWKNVGQWGQKKQLRVPTT